MSQLARLIREIDQLKAQLAAATSTPQLAHSAIEGGSIDSYDHDGNLRLRIGDQGDGTQTITVVDGPTPPAPSAPVVAVDGPVLTISWDGHLADPNLPLPADFARIHVHLSQTPDMSSAPVRASIEAKAGASTVTAVETAGTWWVALAVEAQSGRRSPLSAPVEAVVSLVNLDGALEAVRESADGKNRNYYNPVEPSPDDHELAEGDLWFDTSEDGQNMPHRWDGSSWVSVADQRVENVRTAMESMRGDLEGQIEGAAGNKITWSPAAPPSGAAPGKSGDTWFQIQSGRVTGQWAHDGSSWVSRPLSHEVIASLDLGKATVGELDGGRIRAGSVTADRLLVGAGSNILPLSGLPNGIPPGRIQNNAEVEVFSGRQGAYGQGFRVRQNPATASSGWANVFAFRRIAKTDSFAAGDFFPVTPGEEYVFSAKLGLDGDYVGPTPDAQISFYAYTHDAKYITNKSSPVVQPDWNGVPVEYSFVVPATASWMHVVVRTRQAGWVEVAEPSLQLKVGATLISDGAVTTEKLAAGAITAESGVIGSLDLGKATVGELDGARIKFGSASGDILKVGALDGKVITGAVIQTGFEAPHGVFDQDGIRFTDEDGTPTVQLTSHPEIAQGDFLGLRGADGEMVFNVSEGGVVSSRDLSVEADPTVMGKQLLGTQASFSHPSEFAMDGMLDFMPRGMIARAYRNNADRSAFTNTETNILEFSYDHEPSRAYKIVIAPFSMYVDGGNAYGYLNVYITTDGSRPRADGNPTFRQLVRNPGSSRALYDFGGEFYHVTDLPPTTVRILYTFTADGGQVSFFGNASGAAIRTWVEDMGLSVPDTGVDRNERREITSTAPPPDPTEPERRNYTKTYTATGGRTFWTSGGYRTDNTQYAYQGNGPYGGSQRSIILFPSMTGDLSGAEITSMRVYLYFEHWYYSSGGEAKIHVHSRTALPTSIPAMEGMATSSNWPKPGGRWVNIPRSMWNRFKSGDLRGIGLGNPSGNRTQYGYARVSATKIEVKYRK